MLNRRNFIRNTAFGAMLLGIGNMHAEQTPKMPNIILCMTDDQGWGDTGYNGHPVLKTPNLDAMARAGIRFNRFYSAAPVCTPTRGSCLTGRDPYRYGIYYANKGHMKEEEITIAEALKTKGYATGHFGKWHLGTLTVDMKDGNRGAPGNRRDYSPPWENGFDTCFSTESKVPTYNPMEDPENPGAVYMGQFKRGENRYWTGPQTYATENLEGDDSRIIMDRAIPFIEQAVESSRPFLALIWFHTPHVPVIGPPEEMEMYAHVEDHRARNYYAALTAMDKQIGRLRGQLERLGVADNTMLWFCSDNGPDFLGGAVGSTGGLRGRKHHIWEGGIRVPGLLVWPAKIKSGRASDIPCSTNDYYPTILDALGFEMPKQPRPLDGISLMPLIEGEMESRPTPMAFQSTKHNEIALIDNRYKIIRSGEDEDFQLYDLVEDPGEESDLAFLHQAIIYDMEEKLMLWKKSCTESNQGKDYRDDE